MRLPDWSSRRRGRLTRASARTSRHRPRRREVLLSYDALLEGWSLHEVVLVFGPANPLPLRAVATDAFPRAHVPALTPTLSDVSNGASTAADGLVVGPNVHQAHAALLPRRAPDLILDDGGCPASLLERTGA